MDMKTALPSLPDALGEIKDSCLNIAVNAMIARTAFEESRNAGVLIRLEKMHAELQRNASAVLAAKIAIESMQK